MVLHFEERKLWDADKKNNFLLEDNFPYQRTSYTRARAGTPGLDDRDLVIQSLQQSFPPQENGFLAATRSLVDNKNPFERYMKPQHGCMRAIYRGEWGLKTRGNSSTEVTIYSSVKPGGNIPNWMSNLQAYFFILIFHIFFEN